MMTDEFYLTADREGKMRKMLRKTLPAGPNKAELIDLAVHASKEAERAFFAVLSRASSLEVVAELFPLASSVAAGVFRGVLEVAIDHARANGANLKIKHAQL